MENPTDLRRASRRTFLSRSSAAVAGAALGSAVARTAHAAGDETIKVALVGCGSRGTGAASQALKTKGPMKLWAMADLFEDRLEASLANLTKGQQADYDREAHGGFAGKIDVPPERRFVGFEAYKQAIDSGVDLVILTATQHFRPEHYQYAVRQGKHVFMEKPLAVDVPGVRRVLAANEEAKKKNLKVVAGFMSRHDPRYQETIKRLHDGAVGRIGLMRCYWNTGFLRDTPPRAADEAEMVYQLRHPYHFLWLSGDYFVDALIHAIDTCLWAKGVHPVAAQGQGGRQFRLENQSGDGFDHHFVEYTFEDESKMFAQTRQISGCWNCGSKYVHGEKGIAWIDRGQIEAAEKWRFQGSVGNPYQIEHDVLIDAIRNDKPHNETEYAAISTMTAILGRMATYSGQMITWDDAMKSTVSLAPEVYALDAAPPVVADANGQYPVAMPGVTKVL
ncbi:MAG: Gfo/Idh/MocA family oxidoreductase [Planctomycetaceae bacterium]|nr:Gfo/Idh/MocA family oxidoreductase [Planctomycetaceae bacterium]